MPTLQHSNCDLPRFTNLIPIGEETTHTLLANEEDVTLQILNLLKIKKNDDEGIQDFMDRFDQIQAKIPKDSIPNSYNQVAFFILAMPSEIRH